MEKDDLTYKIIGCAIKVHNTMGPGFQEVIYQRCLAIELERAGLSYKREQDKRYTGNSPFTINQLTNQPINQLTDQPLTNHPYTILTS